MNEATKQIEEVKLRRFRRYPEYKDSGIEWLGEIPAHWDMKKIKRFCLVRRGASPRPIDDPAYFEDEGEYAWVRIADVTASEKYLETTTQRLSELGKSKSVSLEPGELFLSIAATVGKPIIARIKCCIHDGFVYFVGLRQNREYLFYLFSCGEAYKGLGKLGTQLNLNTDTIGDIYVPLPQPAEQRAIVQFLERETARIDGLVARKERLIELLREKRAALISRAVTRGLDPNAPMKDSGVEWLGEIPVHWEVKQLNHLLKARKGAIKTGPFGSQLKSSSMQAGEIKVYNQRSVLDRDFSSGDNYVSLEKFAELSAFEVYPGDLLITTRGSIGRCSILPKEAERGVLHPCLMRVQPDERWILTRFLEIQIEGCSIVLDQLRFMSNATTIDVIYSDSLRQVWLSVPPVEEQTATIAFVAREKARIDALIAKVRQAIDHLKEFRTALISAAVTGKIDVREAAS